MADFYAAIKHIIANEGGFSDHPADPGGTTKYGISLRFLKASENDINDDGTIDKEDIKALTSEAAKDIYEESFWSPNKYSQIKSQAVATKVFDTCVNVGQRTANKMLQRSVNFCLKKKLLIEDGIIGQATIDATNNCEEDLLLDYMCHQASVYYNGLCDKNPSLKVFRNGWLRRANRRYGR